MKTMDREVPSLIDARAVEVRALGSQIPLLRDVSLTIAAGERIALVGHNGAGKSTLLRALAGFCAVTGGSLKVHGMELSGRSRQGAALRRLRSRIAQVHQGLHLVDRLQAIDNVLIGGASRCASPLTWVRRWPEAERAAAMAALARVGMDWAAHRRTDSLSGGERQKVAIARALQQRAPILLADEPTASLDAQAADSVLELLGAVAREHGLTLICVLHDLQRVPQLATRAICLRRGRVVADLVVTSDAAGQLAQAFA